MYPKSANIQYEGWMVEEAIGEGASARVFKVSRGNLLAALKVFDPAVFREDAEAQERLSRQSVLIGHSIPGLIQILEIKEALIDGHIAPAILMEFKGGSSLEKTDLRDSLTLDEVRHIISSVSRTANELLKTKGIVHRDIKPANILYDQNSNAVTLLDTGVIRPLEGVNEVSGYLFVGTRRYSPPEFICRTHDSSSECWESITFYQLGATLYELATKMRPYENIKVEAQVTIAIQKEPPDFSKLSKLPSDLRSLICLSLRREWKKRLIGLNWERFINVNQAQDNPSHISKTEANELIVGLATISVGREKRLESSLGTLLAAVRESVLGSNCTISFDHNKSQARVSIGPDAGNIKSAFCLILHPGHDELSILEVSYYEKHEAEFYVVTSDDLDAMSEILKQKAAEYI